MNKIALEKSKRMETLLTIKKRVTDVFQKKTDRKIREEKKPDKDRFK